jgi:hypothetical protein
MALLQIAFRLGTLIADKGQEAMAAVAQKAAQEAALEAEREALSQAQQDALEDIPVAEQEAMSELTQFGASVPSDSLNTVLAQEIRRGEDKRRQAAVIGRRNNILRGVTPKEETVASLRIIANLQALTGLVSTDKKATGGFLVYGTDQFILQAASEADNEKVQIIETFGEPVAYFYGRRPRTYTYGGILYNSADVIPSNFVLGADPNGTYSGLWRDNFKLAYDLFLRGTRCVRFKARAYLTYDRVVREGFIIRSSIEQDVNPNQVRLMFSMFITREVNLDSVLAIQSNTLDGLVKGANLSDQAILDAAKRKTRGALSRSEIAVEQA